MNTIFAQRLKTARSLAGMSQTELAEKLGVTKQAISKYEQGKMLPDSQVLIKLSRILGQKPDFFNRPFSVKLDQVEFRKRSVLSGRKLKVVKAKVTDKLERYLELEELLGVGFKFKNPVGNIAISCAEDVEKASMHLLKKWELGFNPLPNIIEMLEDKGIKIIEIEAENSFDGQSTWVKGNIPVIVLNRNFHVVRKRFTVLHELGHLLLAIPEDSSKKLKESYCNRFAGAMLIPRPVCIRELGKKREHLSLNELIEIKEYYGISIAALVYRAADLGIISGNTARRFWQKRNRDPQLKNETGLGDYLGKEHSGRFRQLLFKALAEEVISLSKAAALSGESIVQLRRDLQFV